MRWLAAAVAGVLFVGLSTQDAQAVLAAHAASPSAVLPQQRSESAANLPHQVGAAATRGKTGSRASSPQAVTPNGALPAASVRASGATPRASSSSEGKLTVEPVTPPKSVRDGMVKARQQRSLKAAAGDGPAAQGDPGIPGPGATGVEVPADRTANTSVFRNDDGTMTARVYSRPVHFQSTDGTWTDIDTTLARGADGRWSERADAPSATFANSSDDAALVSYAPVTGESVSFGLQGAAKVNAQTAQNAITYPNIAASSDLTYTATTAGVKETFVLHDASAPTTWVFPLRVSGLTAAVTKHGDVEFSDAAGKVQQTIPHGFMEDANRGAVSNEGAISTGVVYSLLTNADGTQSLKVSLDAAWLHDPARAFPVKVDPTTTSNLNASSSTYVETPYNINFSTNDTLKVGSYDGAVHSANSYLLFSSVGSTFKNDYIEQASLYVDDVWAGGCTAQPVRVSPITSSWSVGSITDFPGLSYGSAIGTSSFYAGASCGGSAWHGIDLGDNPSAAGTKLIEGWAHGGNNLGLALTADTSEVSAWKQFASVHSSYPPYLSITYSPYGADFSLPSQTYTQPTAVTNGSMQVQVTNRGTAAWTPSNTSLAADVYDMSWNQVKGANAPKVAVPSTVNPNSTVTMTGTIGAIAAGQYYECWDMYLNGSTSFNVTYNVPTLCAKVTSADAPPQIDSTAPASNAVLGSLTPELFATGHDPDNYPGKGLTYDFQVYSNPPGGVGPPTLVVDSGAVSATHWVVPAGKLAWNQSYSWTVSNSDTLASSAWSNPSSFSTTVPQPLITSHLGAAAQADGKSFSPQVGDYTTQATDASVSVVGPKLAITRSYNSLDPRTATLFGAGWSTPYDVFATPDNDGSGAVVVTQADGHTVRFGLNSDNTTFTPPQGTYATFTVNTGGGYTLTDKSATVYTFGQQVTGSWKLTKATDRDGRSETLAYNADGTLATVTNTASNRTLHFTWSASHVTQVATDPATSGATAAVWSYSYSGDQLTKVCPPTSATACTTYSYTSGSNSGSHYRSAVTDANPASYWRLADASGTRAASEAALNEGNDSGTYSASGITLGAAGPLPGSPTTAATFDGTSGSLSLPNALLSSASYTAVGMWFKTTGSGVLFSYQSDPLSKGSTQDYTPALYVGTSGKLYGQLWQGGVSPISTAGSVADGKWHYVVLSAAGNTQSLYLDASLVGTLSGQIQASTQPVDLIGAGYTGGHWPDEPHYSTTSNTAYPSYFSGQIAETAFYTHPLGLPAIQQQYQAGTHASTELTGITLPSGKTRLAAAYDAARDRAAQITDNNGATWNIGAPTTTGSGAYYRNAIISTPVTDYWRLGEASGSQAMNEVPSHEGSPYWNGNPGTYNNVTLGTPGLFTGDPATAATFNGTTSYLALPATPSVTDNLPEASIELWFKTTTAGGVLLSYQNQAIGSTPTNWTPALYVGADGLLYGQLWDGRVSPLHSEAAVTDGAWHQAALTNSSQNVQTLYVDGQQVATRTGSSLYPGDQQTVSLGAGYMSGWPAQPSNNVQGYFKGSITEVSDYLVALSAATVNGHYTARGAASGATPATTVQVTDPLHKTLSYQYDPGNGSRLISATDALNHTTAYTYDTSGFLATTTDPDGNFTTSTHNARGDVLSRTTGGAGYSGQHTSYFTYPAVGTYALTDPRNDEATGSADARSAGPADTKYATAYTYSATGDPLTTTDPDGHTATSTYTTGTEAAMGGGIQPAGLPATSRDARGKITSYAYDSAGDLVQVVSPSGLKTTYTYDSLGRRLTQKQISDTYPNGISTSYTYDTQNRLTSRSGPATTDAVTGTVHTLQTSYAFDDDGSTTSVQTADTTGGDKTRTSNWTYNTHDQVASTTDPLGRTTSYGYDNYGNRTTQTTPDGNAYTYAYAPNGELLTTTLTNFTGDPVNPSPSSTLVLDSRAYDPAGLLASDTDAMGRTTSYSYDWDQQLTSSNLSNYHQTDGSSTTRLLHQYNYDAAGHLIERQDTDMLWQTDYTVDPAGLTTKAAFDANDPFSTCCVNRVTANSYDENGNLTTQSHTGGGTTEQVDYAYDAVGDVTSQTVHNGSNSLVSTATYDQRGYLTSTTDPRGNAAGANAAAYTTSYAHDEAGQLTQTTAPVVNAEANGAAPQQTRPISLYGYDTFGDRTSTDDPDGNITTYTFDADAEQVAVSQAAYTAPGSATSITPTQTAVYDAAGRMVSLSDGNGNTGKITYDQLGDAAQLTQPAVNGTTPTVHKTYDADGEPLSSTSATGAASYATYDDLGEQLTASTVVRQPTAVTATTTFGYDTAGNRTSVSLPGGQTSQADYDAASERISATDALGNVTKYAYDLDGRLTKTTLPDSTATTRSYDLAGRLTSTMSLDASGKTLAASSVGYDPAGNAVLATDANGATRTYAYNPQNHLTQQTEPVSTTSSITTSFGYDAAGHRTRYTDGNNHATVNTYNTLGLPESVIEPTTTEFPNAGDRTTSISYDANHHPVTVTRPGGVTQTNTYDADGRRITQTGTGAEAATTARTFGYDADGRLTLASAPTGSNTYTYNDRGQLLTTSGPSGSASYTYNTNGQITARTDKAGTAAFTYDADGHLATATDPLTAATATYTRNSLGQITGIAYGTNSASQTLGYDAQHQLNSQTLKSPGGATEASTNYSYDTAGHITTQTTTGTAGAGTSTYTYDQSGRLTTANNGTATTSYGYDSAGNRTSTSSGSSTTTAAYNARNQLTATTSGATTTTYQRTARGSLASVTGTTTESIAADAFDQTVTDGTTTYTHDALGRLTTAGSNTFSYNGTESTVVSDGTETYARTPGGSLLSVSGTSGAALAYTNQHGDMTATFTPTGTTLAGSTAYDPYGQKTASTNTQHNLGYQGGWTDPATGRVSTASRLYDPTTATFTTHDPTTQNPTPSVAGNAYAYANDDPLDNTDPSGNSSCSTHSTRSGHHHGGYSSNSDSSQSVDIELGGGNTPSYDGDFGDENTDRGMERPVYPGLTVWGGEGGSWYDPFRRIDLEDVEVGAEDVGEGVLEFAEAEVLEFLSYGSCNAVGDKPTPPPPPTAKDGLKQNPGVRPTGQATGTGTNAQPGTKNAGTGPGVAAPVNVSATVVTPTAHAPATNGTVGNADPSGGLGSSTDPTSAGGEPCAGGLLGYQCTANGNLLDPDTGTVYCGPGSGGPGNTCVAQPGADGRGARVSPISPSDPACGGGRQASAQSTCPTAAALRAAPHPDSVNYPTLDPRKTASEAGGAFTASGYSEDIPAGYSRATIEQVLNAQDSMGRIRTPHPFMDNKAGPGAYYLSHAEKQSSTLRPGDPISVSRDMCDDCVGWFQDRAKYLNTTLHVSDPTSINVFSPDGRWDVYDYPWWK
ncbi:LamG-like jellyroll fold domain-containing protein [Streptomyces violascens]|uniref:LamG-like jellyroll fold domain-containing protein n=1 Tax=Streptomyces violascens TaxID=67381 RepID=UPI0036A6385E